jgi:hypothetical protein
MVEYSIDITESYVEDFYSKIDFASRAEERELRIRFLFREELGCVNGCRGMYLYEMYEIRVNATLDSSTPDEKLVECHERYYVLSHELLHFIARENLMYSGKLSISHMIPYFFIDWAFQEEVDEENVVAAFESTVEYWVLYFDDRCLYRGNPI